MTPSDPATIIISSLYYIVVAVLAVLSVFAVYILLRYGRNKFMGAVVCVLYALFFLTLLQQSHAALIALRGQ